MTPPLQCGHIVWAELADANGVRKARPVVIVSPSDPITASGPLDVVAITSQLPQPLPADHVLLPWHARGHPRTGLNRKCAAVCSWLARIAPADVQSVAGIVPGAVLRDILTRVAALPSRPAAAPPSGSGGAPSGTSGPLRSQTLPKRAEHSHVLLFAGSGGRAEKVRHFACSPLAPPLESSHLHRGCAIADCLHPSHPGEGRN